MPPPGKPPCCMERRLKSASWPITLAIPCDANQGHSPLEKQFSGGLEPLFVSLWALQRPCEELTLTLKLLCPYHYPHVTFVLKLVEGLFWCDAA